MLKEASLLSANRFFRSSQMFSCYTFSMPSYKTTFAIRSIWKCHLQALGSCDRASWAKYEERENQQDATIRCLLSTSVSTCFGYHYAHLQENKGPVTVFGVCLNMFRASLCPSSGEQRPCYCIWCLSQHVSDIIMPIFRRTKALLLYLVSVSTCFGHHYAHLQENKGPVTVFGELFCNKRENVDISHNVFFFVG